MRILFQITRAMFLQVGKKCKQILSSDNFFIWNNLSWRNISSQIFLDLFANEEEWCVNDIKVHILDYVWIVKSPKS